MRHLHTAVSDEIRRNAFDAENVKERQMSVVVLGVAFATGC